jgi:hypothetical protein
VTRDTVEYLVCDEISYGLEWALNVAIVKMVLGCAFKKNGTNAQ